MSELRDLLLDQAERLFTDLVDREALATAERGGEPAALVRAIDEFGLPDALAVPAEAGGLTFADAGALFASLGYHAVPLPIGETMLARALLARAGMDAPAGTIGLVEDVSKSPSVAGGRATAWAVAGGDGRLRLIGLDANGRSPTGSLSRGGRTTIDPAVAPAAEATWPDALPDTATLGAMLRASQIAGALSRVLALSVDHANTRQQFGRPLGRFQAVQQLLAKLAAEAAAARSAADVAWASLDAGALGHAGAVAKIRAGEAARAGAAIAHQVHGAIGVTDEHVLHYFTRRLWEWRLDFGSDGWWAARLGRALRESGDDAWTMLTGRCGAPAAPEAA